VPLKECSFEPVKGWRNEIRRGLILTTLLACSASAFAQTIGIHLTKRRRSKYVRQLSRGTLSQKNLGAMYVEPRDVS
jgi:hypothetical protein